MAKQPQTSADKGTDAKASDAQVATAAAKKLVVAAGCALTSVRGIVGPGEEFRHDDLPSGIDSNKVLEGFLLTGHLVEVDA